MSEATTQVFGLIDLARAPELYEHVARLGPQRAQCLYQGRIDPRVVRVCPHLVELEESDPLARQWRDEGWGRSWGLLIQSRAGFRSVWRRLRHFTQVKLPDGQGPVLFRFWDPRVFRTYMPLVDQPQLSDWFQDIDVYVAESEDGAAALLYSLSGGALAVHSRSRPA